MPQYLLLSSEIVVVHLILSKEVHAVPFSALNDNSDDIGSRNELLGDVAFNGDKLDNNFEIGNDVGVDLLSK